MLETHRSKAALQTLLQNMQLASGEQLLALEQLADQARIFLKQPMKNRIEGENLYLSSIFDWFEEDFTKNGKSLSQYVAPYIQGEIEGKRVKFTTYDWSLNQQ